MYRAVAGYSVLEGVALCLLSIMIGLTSLSMQTVALDKCL